jgi:hypothetical protein
MATYEALWTDEAADIASEFHNDPSELFKDLVYKAESEIGSSDIWYITHDLDEDTEEPVLLVTKVPLDQDHKDIDIVQFRLEHHVVH